ncbi:MAG TPA: polyprenyl synthetase family protein [Candidatus Polarisedimenticolaceae bacterium]|nr:polyprenyl synthetase family protein [Candidatus Polarisedimenticolaceae bacterium]
MPVDSSRIERLQHDPVLAREEIVDLVADDLLAVEELFRESLCSPLRFVDEIGAYVAEGGGKRVRPTLHLLCARLCGYVGPHHVLLATVLELIHCATLIHDDIIDGATLRRGRPSTNRRFGNTATVLFGDFMFAKAMQMALRADSLHVMRKLAELTLRMTEGEMMQTRTVGRLDVSIEQYLDLVERKTSSLFAGCCQIAGVLAGAGVEQEAALGRYGRNLGLAFQLVDDVLDFTGEPHALGKPTASDLREGKATLAVIDLLAAGDGEAAELATRVVGAGSAEAPEVTRLTALLRSSGAIDRTYRRARTYADAAIAELADFPEGPARDALRVLPELLLRRDH